MQEAAVGDGVEGLPELGEPQDVALDEPCGQSSLPRFGLGASDRGAGRVEPSDLESAMPAKNSAFSPVPQPISSTRPWIRPALATLVRCGWAPSMSHGGFA